MIHPHDIYSSFEPWTVRITHIAREFVKKGHDVRLIYFRLDSAAHTEPEEDSLDGIEVTSLSRRIGWGQLFRNIKAMLPHARWADLVHFQKCFHYAVLPALVCSWMANKPVHYDWDDWEAKIYFQGGEPPSLFVGMFLDLMERLIPRMVDTGSYSSQRIQELFIERGMDAEKLVHAPVGADLELFHPSCNGDGVKEEYHITGPLVLYVGQLHGGQYAELFIKAAAGVLKVRPEATFMIVGGGYRLEELRRMGKVLGIGEKVIFTGSVPHHLVPRYITSCDIGVACFENNEITLCKSPLKIVEYLASGKPIVASNVGEVRRMVGGAGLLVQPGDVKGLSDGIMKLLQNPLLREKLGKAARERAESRYNWKATAENILRAYQQATGKA